MLQRCTWKESTVPRFRKKLHAIMHGHKYVKKTSPKKFETGVVLFQGGVWLKALFFVYFRPFSSISSQVFIQSKKAQLVCSPRFNNFWKIFRMSLMYKN